MSINKKILMVTTDHLMIDRRILQEASSLVAHGYDVTLLAGFECPKRESYNYKGIQIERFCYDWNDTRFSRLTKYLPLSSSSIIMKPLWLSFRVWAKYLAKINSFEHFMLRQMMNYQVDILHIHDYPTLAVGVRYADLKQVPLVYDAHELYYAQVQLATKIQKAYKRREAKLIKHPTATITVNPYIAKLMAERYRIPPPHVILNASPLQPIKPHNHLREHFKLKETSPILLYQGWISDNRGIERIVQAISYITHDAVLIIVGYGDYEKVLKELVTELNLQDRVFFYGGVPSEQLHDLTCCADLGIIPYYGVDENNYYCSPNKLFEFTVSGIPFIANDLPFLRDIATKYQHGVLSDLSAPQLFADAVNKILSDDAIISELKASALKARLQINWEIEEQKLLTIYNEL